MPIPENEELAKYRGFDNETLFLRLDMVKQAIRTIVDKSVPGFGIPPTMNTSLRLLTRVARERNLLPRRR